LELISVRHPLLEVVQKDLLTSELLLSKFGTLRLPEKYEVNPSLVALHLARSTGIRPKLELWASAIDLETYEISEEPGYFLLQALAEGTFQNSDKDFSEVDLYRASETVENHVAIKHRNHRKTLSLDNAAIFAERVEAQKLSLANKIKLAQGTLNKVRQDRRDPKIITIYQSRIDRLNRELAEITRNPNMTPAELELEAVAYVIVSN